MKNAALALMGIAAALGADTTGPNPSTAKIGKGMAYIPTTTRTGRRFVGAKGAQLTVTPLSAHNQAIEDARKADLEARAARRATLAPPRAKNGSNAR